MLKRKATRKVRQIQMQWHMELSEKGVDISKPEGWPAIGGRTVAVTGEGLSATTRGHFNEAQMCVLPVRSAP